MYIRVQFPNFQILCLNVLRETIRQYKKNGKKTFTIVNSGV